MKKYIFLFLLILIYSESYSQDEKYVKLMKETKVLIDSANNISTLLKAAHQFQRIADAAQNQWLPFYYCAYCYVQISHKEKKDKIRDEYVDLAETYNNKADELSPNNSEIYVMKGFILQAKMDIDRMGRGLKYNEECLKMFERAKQLNPDNPRGYLWQGVSLYNTPSVFGGGKDKALPLFQKAEELYKSVYVTDSISPDWGKKYLEGLMEKYN